MYSIYYHNPNQMGLRETTNIFCLFIAELLQCSNVFIFGLHYIHQEMMLYEDTWLGWSFYILPLGGASLLPAIVVFCKVLQCGQEIDAPEYLLDSVNT